MLDALIAPEPAIGLAQRPADFGEFSAGCLGHPAFEPQHAVGAEVGRILAHRFGRSLVMPARRVAGRLDFEPIVDAVDDDLRLSLRLHVAAHHAKAHPRHVAARRSEEHTSELQSLMRISYAVFCLKKKKTKKHKTKKKTLTSS